MVQKKWRYTCREGEREREGGRDQGEGRNERKGGREGGRRQEGEKKERERERKREMQQLLNLPQVLVGRLEVRESVAVSQTEILSHRGCSLCPGVRVQKRGIKKLVITIVYNPCYHKSGNFSC